MICATRRKYDLPLVHFYLQNFWRKNCFITVRPFSGLKKQARCPFLCFLTLQVLIQYFQVISTSSSGKKYVLGYFPIKTSLKPYPLESWKQKMFKHDSQTFFVYKSQNFLFQKFSRRPPGPKTQ